ncbi:MAG: hypothetical protein J6J82_04175 [Alphaproteobacteria bacterium]|nr:hypothetical protein [Alphaproteobacteria bacterium]
MHRFIYVLFIFIAFCAHARTLHVGDNTIKLSSVKTTTPALHIKVDNEIWYGNMCTNFNTNSLHIKYNGTVYDVIEPFTNTTNYTYDENGRLIAANENAYLESTGTQYIDTLHVPTLVTRSELEIKFSDDGYKTGTGQGRFFGIIDRINKSNYTMNWANNTNILFWLCLWSSIGGPSWCQPIRTNIDSRIKTTKQLLVLDAKDNHVHYSTTSLQLQGRQTTENYSIYLFGSHVVESNGTETASVYDSNNSMYIYSTKIYEDDVLARHFVPVPCGLQIGDFVVPSNGMWDIVEQKFYGNMGSGDFIYGMDE